MLGEIDPPNFMTDAVDVGDQFEITFISSVPGAASEHAFQFSNCCRIGHDRRRRYRIDLQELTIIATCSVATRFLLVSGNGSLCFCPFQSPKMNCTPIVPNGELPQQVSTSPVVRPSSSFATSPLPSSFSLRSLPLLLLVPLSTDHNHCSSYIFLLSRRASLSFSYIQSNRRFFLSFFNQQL